MSVGYSWRGKGACSGWEGGGGFEGGGEWGGVVVLGSETGCWFVSRRDFSMGFPVSGVPVIHPLLLGTHVVTAVCPFTSIIVLKLADNPII